MVVTDRLSLSLLFALFGLLVVPVQAQDRLAHCSDEIAGEGVLKMVMSDVAAKHTCGRQDPPITFEDMLSRCEAFCAPAGIPIPIGTDGAGFNKSEIDDICMGRVTNGASQPILRYDPWLMAQCEDWGEAVQDINLRAADFIASVTNMTFEQLVYRAAMAEKVAEMQVVITSDEVQEELELERIDRKMQRIQDIISDNLADLMQSGMLSRNLKGRLDNLEDKASLLMTVIDRELPKLTNYTEQCNVVLLATGPLNEYALDICSQTSDECVEGEFGQHVGCCCGVIPAVGATSISASRDGTRRLQPNEGAATEEVDVCGKAAEVGATDLQDTVDRLRQIGGGDAMLEAYDVQQREAYPCYYQGCEATQAADDQNCNAARRLDKLSPTKTQMPKDLRALQKVPKDEQQKVSRSSKYAWMTEQQQRNLQSSYLTCEAPSGTTNSEVGNDIDVTFWQHTEQALCKNIVEEENGDMTNDRLASLCAAFCSPDSIPLMLGTTSFGFSQAQMDEVCLQPDREGAVYNAATIDQCHESASVFTRLQDRTADFATSLQVLAASRLRFQAYARTAQDELRAVILRDAQPTLDNAASSQKLAALQDLIATALDDILGGSGAKRTLQIDAGDVSLKATALREELAVAVDGLRTFLSDCNFLTTGVGPSQEYLLDLCSQTSMECIENAEGVHAGCCCGYNPIITLGTDGVAAGTATILGTGADIFSQSPAPPPPPPPPTGGEASPPVSQAAPVLSSIIDICAKAYTDAKPRIDEYYADIDSEGQANLYLQAEEDKRERYTDYYGRCAEPESRWTWSDAARGQFDSLRGMFSSSSPAIRVCPVDVPLLAMLLFCVWQL